MCQLTTFIPSSFFFPFHHHHYPHHYCSGVWRWLCVGGWNEELADGCHSSSPSTRTDDSKMGPLNSHSLNSHSLNSHSLNSQSHQSHSRQCRTSHLQSSQQHHQYQHDMPPMNVMFVCYLDSSNLCCEWLRGNYC